MGAAQARLFAQEGACVVGGDIQEDLGQQTFEEIVAAGGQAMFVRLDVTDPESWQSCVSATLERFGGLTTLINTAGTYDEGTLESTDLDSWGRTVAVDQTGVFLGMRTALPELLKCEGGAIVNIASILAFRGTPQNIGYCASKGAVRAMGKASAIELAKRGVRVNTIFPGLILTPMTTRPEQAEALKALDAIIPMGHGGQPEDIASATVFLASDEARYITGAELVVDGGWTASA
jgi:2,5-dichloro-2,5-cyclohexadiene-1,4-diol dehydrogenase 2